MKSSTQQELDKQPQAVTGHALEMKNNNETYSFQSEDIFPTR